jgi:hypothetical protein
MLRVKKSVVLDEKQRPYAVLLSIKDFERIEEALENYGLAKLMDEPRGPTLGLAEAKKYYAKLRKNKLGKPCQNFCE